MTGFLIDVVLFAISLCADSFAVALCSSVTLKRLTFGNVSRTALAFALIQAGLLVAGFAFGQLFAGLVEKLARIIGFVLLLYVGGSMAVGGIRGEAEETRDLNSWRNIILGGIATSIDALAVGVSLCLAAEQWRTTLVQTAAVFVFTAISVVTGIVGGKKIGEKAGRWARIIGGAVLIAIGAGLFF